MVRNDVFVSVMLWGS